MDRKERALLSKKDIVRTLRAGLIPFTLDRELALEVKNFMTTPIGSYVDLKGFLIYKYDSGTLVLRPLPTNPHIEIELEGLSPHIAEALHGDPVVVTGIRRDRWKLEIENIKRCSLVSRPPPIGIDYVKNSLLDGVELAVPEELGVLTIVSAPRIPITARPGGLHASLIGNGKSYVDRRLRRNTISMPYIWRYGRIEPAKYPLYTRSSKALRYAELSLNVDIDTSEKLIKTPTDYPLIIIRASKPPKVVDFDVMDYSIYVKALKPRIEDVEKLNDFLTRISAWLSTWIEKNDVPSILVGSGKLLDLNYLGKPITVLRIASALARIHWCTSLDTFVEEAKVLLIKAIERVLELFSSRPTRILRLRELEAIVLKIIEKLESTYRDGVPFNAIAEELKIKGVGLRELEYVLERLRNRGLIYSPRPGKYRTILI